MHHVWLGIGTLLGDVRDTQRTKFGAFGDVVSCSMYGVCGGCAQENNARTSYHCMG